MDFRDLGIYQPPPFFLEVGCIQLASSRANLVRGQTGEYRGGRRILLREAESGMDKGQETTSRGGQRPEWSVLGVENKILKKSGSSLGTKTDSGSSLGLGKVDAVVQLLGQRKCVRWECRGGERADGSHGLGRAIRPPRRHGPPGGMPHKRSAAAAPGGGSEPYPRGGQAIGGRSCRVSRSGGVGGRRLE